ELLTLKGHTAGVWCVAVSPDGQQIAAGGEDRTVKVWQAGTAQQVALWQEQDKSVAESLAVLRRQAQDAGSLPAQGNEGIKQWLVLAPMAFEGRNMAAAVAALDHEQIPREAHLRARAAERVKGGQSELVWRAVLLPDYLLDFNQLLGEKTEWS